MDRVTFFFLYTLFLFFTIPPFFPNLHLFFFTPFLILTFYNRPKITCIWLALTCGFIVDLFSAHSRLGTYALNYCLTVLILYPYKKHFFEDSLTTFPIMTFIFSFLSTLIEVAILYLFRQSFSLSWEWFIDDLIFMPLVDSFYAALAFTLPYLSLPRGYRKRPTLFSIKEN